MSDVTRILSAIEPRRSGQGGRGSYCRLGLRGAVRQALAARRLAREKPGQTIQATALVHEAYVRLVEGEAARRWNSRGHFFAAAAEAMRRILIDNARRKQTEKHGGVRRVDLDIVDPPADPEGEDHLHDLLALDEALSEFARREPLKAELVKLRYFAGLSVEEAAACLGISAVTAKRYWAVARARLYAALADGDAAGPENNPHQGDTPST